MRDTQERLTGLRPIRPLAIVIAHVLMAYILVASAAYAWWMLRWLRGNEYHALATVAVFAVVAVALTILADRAVLGVQPIPLGPLPLKMSLGYQVHLLIDLMILTPLLTSHLLPIPLVMWVYRALGAKVGRNSYTAGVICEPSLVTIGDHCVLGIDSVISGHTVIGSQVDHQRVTIGHHVTIGGGAGILPGVTIGDGAVVGVNSAVMPGTMIGSYELWSGTPARYRGLAPA